MKFNTLSKLLYVIVNVNGKDVQIPYSIFGNDKFIKIIIQEEDLKDVLSTYIDNKDSPPIKDSNIESNIESTSSKFLTIDKFKSRYDIYSPVFKQYLILLNNNERNLLEELNSQKDVNPDKLQAFTLCDHTCKKLCDVLNLFNIESIKDIESCMYTDEAKELGKLMLDELQNALKKGGCSSCKKRSIKVKYQKLLVAKLSEDNN